MSTASRPYPIVQDLIESFAAWLKHRREMNEMRQLDRADFDRIAQDLRIAPDDLEELVRHGKHAADELPRMLEQLGISADRLGRAQPLLLRDMERVCSLCNQKGQCDRDRRWHRRGELPRLLRQCVDAGVARSGRRRPALTRRLDRKIRSCRFARKRRVGQILSRAFCTRDSALPYSLRRHGPEGQGRPRSLF